MGLNISHTFLVLMRWKKFIGPIILLLFCLLLSVIFYPKIYYEPAEPGFWPAEGEVKKKCNCYGILDDDVDCIGFARCVSMPVLPLVYTDVAEP